MFKKNPKYIVILKALEIGLEIKLPGKNPVTIWLDTNEDGNRKLYWKATNMNSGELEYFGLEMDLSVFMNLCEKFSDEAVTIVAADTALNKINKRQRQRNLTMSKRIGTI